MRGIRKRGRRGRRGREEELNVMPEAKNPNFWKVKKIERKWRRKRSEGEGNGIKWGESNIESTQ